MIQQFYEKLKEVQPDLDYDTLMLISKRFSDSMEFINEKAGMEDKRFQFYKDSGVFERHIYLDYGLKPVPNRYTTLNAMMDVAFEIKTNAKITSRKLISA